MAVAGGIQETDLLNLKPSKPGRVLYLAGEDPEAALVRRVHAIGQHMHQEAHQAIAQNLVLQPILGKRLDIMNHQHLRSVIEAAQGARLVVLDTLSRIHGLDENSNGDMARLISQLEYVAAQTGARACYELYRMMVRVVGRVQGCLVGPTPAM
jgi:RecA-family ATPase